MIYEAAPGVSSNSNGAFRRLTGFGTAHQSGIGDPATGVMGS